MKYLTAGAFRTALEQRLLTLARESGIPVARLRKLVVFDRLMARLLLVAQDRWLLKGAVAFNFRVGARFRTTNDLDLARQDSEEAATADPDDYFRFAIQRTARLDATLEGAAVRYHVTAELAGRPFDDVIVDVGFGDPPVPDPEVLRGPDLLGFAGIAPIEVPALPLEEHVAEKVHAYTRIYGGGRPSSRVKDLIDLVLISSSYTFQAGRLGRALRTTFDIRATHQLPAALPPTPSDWGPAYRRMAVEVQLAPDVRLGHAHTAAFLDPVLGGMVPDAAAWDQATPRGARNGHRGYQAMASPSPWCRHTALVVTSRLLRDYCHVPWRRHPPRAAPTWDPASHPTGTCSTCLGASTGGDQHAAAPRRPVVRAEGVDTDLRHGQRPGRLRSEERGDRRTALGVSSERSAIRSPTSLCGGACR